jgi:hypothetical protein
MGKGLAVLDRDASDLQILVRSHIPHEWLDPDEDAATREIIGACQHWTR